MPFVSRQIVAVDLFCGAGGLTHGLESAGIEVVAGVDMDPAARFPFEHNNAGEFVQADVEKMSGRRLLALYPPGAIRVLAGCAPCAPYSTLRNAKSARATRGWRLLDEFTRLVRSTRPHLVTMENVPKLRRTAIFRRFVATLVESGYSVDTTVVRAERFGVPQFRRRLVLVASRVGEISAPIPLGRSKERTVRDAIGKLPRIRAGAPAIGDRLHRSAGLRSLNLKRIRASAPGRSWRDWDPDLRLECHARRRGRKFSPVYGRMRWDRPSPTITTQSFNYGSGRFGHPSQRRAISLREAAILQTFPSRYQFVPRGERVNLRQTGRLIGNAVPPRLGYHIGRALLRSAGRLPRGR